MGAARVGRVDNGLVGADMTIGTDSALHRILEAIDDISSTAASHQRTFVVEVMGRHCGYLALMAAVAGGCDYVLVPELPPGKDWEEDMCSKLKAGREAGRRESMVIVAEGATDREGNRITADDVRQVIADKLGEAARVTILGHVQRGGRPSAYDRWMSTLLGCAAAREVVSMDPGSEPVIIAERHNRIRRLPMMEQIAATRAVKDLVAAHDYLGAIQARGAGFGDEVKRRIILGTHVLSAGYYDAYYGSAQKVRTLVQRDFAAAWDKADILVSPTAPVTAYRFGEKDDPLAMYKLDVTTIPANLAGVPGMSLPSGLSDDGLPVGFQILAPQRADDRLYRVGAVLEAALEETWGAPLLSRAPELEETR